MSPEQKEFLSLKTSPARLTAENVAWRLGFQPHDIPVLVAAGLLPTLGHPASNEPKFFANAEVELLQGDRKWLARATDAIHRHWQKKNSRRKSFEDAPEKQDNVRLSS